MSNFNSICSSIVALDRTKQNVIEYFTTVWMPSKDHIPAGCQITGFAPVRPHDGEIAFQVVQGAFQTNDEVSMYALLSAGSRRMQVLHGKDLQRKDFPDLYTFKAIQALRKRIEKGETASERLILDLSFLILAELFTPSTKRSETYWSMIRSLIVQVGGLQCLTTFTAQIAMGFDHQISAGTLSKPALDPFTYTELLGYQVPTQTPSQESSKLIKLLLGQLDHRLRLIALQSHALTQLIDAINRFPEKTVDGIRHCLRSHLKQLYSIIPDPLRREDGREDAPDTQNSQNLIAADGIYLHARVASWRVWTFSATLSFLPPNYNEYLTFPKVVTNELSQTWRSLDRILYLLHGTGWIIRREVLVWIVAVGYFAATEEADRNQYRRHLQQVAFTVDASTPERLKDALSGMFPLDLMQADAYERLWEVMRGRSQTWE